MFLNLNNGWYFDGKLIWDILQLTNKFLQVTTKFFWSNWISKICWAKVLFEMIKDFLKVKISQDLLSKLFFAPWLEKSFSSSLLITDWLILANSVLKYSLLKNLASSLVLFGVFDCLLGWHFEQFADLSNHMVLLIWYHHAWLVQSCFSCIGNVSSVAVLYMKLCNHSLELVEFRSRFSNFSRMVFTNCSLMSHCFKQLKLTLFFVDTAAHFTF